MTTPLICVLGPTASGKTALSLRLAQALGGEIVSADAMAVYRGLEIGTAKPGPAERAAVPHHALDLAEPEERCDVARWLGAAEAAISEIRGRGRVPVVAGGSPLSVKILLEGLSAGPPQDAELRARLQERHRVEGGEVLLAELRAVDPVYAAERHANDARRLVRALEVWQLTGLPYSSFHTTDGIRRPEYRPLLLGLAWPRPVLHQRIAERVEAMFAAGLVAEVTALRERLSPEAAQAVGYKEVLAHLDGAYDLAACRERVIVATRRLAKHQHTWLRRFEDLRWLPGEAPDLGDQALALAQSHLGHGQEIQS